MQFPISILAVAGLATAQSLSASSATPASTVTSYSYSNAATTLLTQTDSNGVITGQPAQPTIITTQPGVVTSQPVLVTSQNPAALVPAGFGTGIYSITAGNQTFTVSIGVSGSSTVTSLVSSTPSSARTTGTAGSGANASGSASRASASASSTGAAAHIRAGVGALAAAGGVFGIFL